MMKNGNIGNQSAKNDWRKPKVRRKQSVFRTAGKNGNLRQKGTEINPGSTKL